MWHAAASQHLHLKLNALDAACLQQLEEETAALRNQIAHGAQSSKATLAVVREENAQLAAKVQEARAATVDKDRDIKRAQAEVRRVQMRIMRRYPTLGLPAALEAQDAFARQQPGWVSSEEDEEDRQAREAQQAATEARRKSREPRKPRSHTTSPARQPTQPAEPPRSQRPIPKPAVAAPTVPAAPTAPTGSSTTDYVMMCVVLQSQPAAALVAAAPAQGQGDEAVAGTQPADDGVHSVRDNTEAPASQPVNSEAEQADVLPIDTHVPEQYAAGRGSKAAAALRRGPSNASRSSVTPTGSVGLQGPVEKHNSGSGSVPGSAGVHISGGGGVGDTEAPLQAQGPVLSDVNAQGEAAAAEVAPGIEAQVSKPGAQSQEQHQGEQDASPGGALDGGGDEATTQEATTQEATGDAAAVGDDVAAGAGEVQAPGGEMGVCESQDTPAQPDPQQNQAEEGDSAARTLAAEDEGEGSEGGAGHEARSGVTEQAQEVAASSEVAGIE